MTINEAITARHSVRRYIDKPLEADAVRALEAAIEAANIESGLHFQLVLDEPKAFSGGMAYGQFSGVSSYIVVAAKPGDGTDEKIGYYGERLVLLAQTLGINSCWAGLTYRKIKEAYTLNDGEKVICMIALGYGQTQGVQHKNKALEQVSNISDDSPAWFRKGIEAALLAPTAVNQQKFRLEWLGGYTVKASTDFSMVGYTMMDLGIVKYHFETGAGDVEIEWR